MRVSLNSPAKGSKPLLASPLALAKEYPLSRGPYSWELAYSSNEMAILSIHLWD
jgi:hypothetical protein